MCDGWQFKHENCYNSIKEGCIMKKDGIINQELMSELTGLGHTESFLICDAGFPIPRETKKIDLSLIKGVPTVIEVIKALSSEVLFEEVYIAEECFSENEPLAEWLFKVFINQRKEAIKFTDFAEKAKKCKFIIRTGDISPYSNVLLTAASGVLKYNEELDIYHTIICKGVVNQ